MYVQQKKTNANRFFAASLRSNSFGQDCLCDLGRCFCSFALYRSTFFPPMHIKMIKIGAGYHIKIAFAAG